MDLLGTSMVAHSTMEDDRESSAVEGLILGRAVSILAFLLLVFV